MIKIIDVGYLRDKKIETYLNEDIENKLAFTDFACMEVLKGKTSHNIKKSLEIVSKYAKQILILKCLPEILKIDFNSISFREELIDNDQTLTFSKFCTKVINETDPDTAFAKDLLKRSCDASKALDEKVKESGLILEGISSYSKNLDKNFLKYIRLGKKWTTNEYQYVGHRVLELCKKLFEMNIDKTQLPKKENFLNHYVFRYALSGFFLVLKWLEESGWRSYSRKKMRNDMVDMSYVAYATYFNGVLSNDKKINAIYLKVLDFINHLRQNT